MIRGRRYNFSDAVKMIDCVSLTLFGEMLFNFYGRCPEKGFDSIEHFVSDLLLSDEDKEKALLRLNLLSVPLLSDAQNIFLKDPAATSVDEIIYSYPGFFAVFCHRVAHIMYDFDIALLARMMSEYAHSLTGIDIHPGAVIQDGFAIDHGTGIVIGETAEIGQNVTVYHGVTVGAKGVVLSGQTKPDRKLKRHPTVERGCIICAGAQIFGGNTVIGENSIISAGVKVVSSVPPGTVVH